MRIGVQAAPINPNDLHILRGRYGLAPELPAVLGQDSVGVIDALGDGVNGAAVDERVTTIGVMGPARTCRARCPAHARRIRRDERDDRRGAADQPAHGTAAGHRRARRIAR